MDERAVIEKHMPRTVKEAVANFRTYSLLDPSLTPEDITLEKISMHVGDMVLNRKAKWQPVAEGLVALQKLGG